MILRKCKKGVLYFMWYTPGESAGISCSPLREFSVIQPSNDGVPNDELGIIAMCTTPILAGLKITLKSLFIAALICSTDPDLVWDMMHVQV